MNDLKKLFDFLLKEEMLALSSIIKNDIRFPPGVFEECAPIIFESILRGHIIKSRKIKNTEEINKNNQKKKRYRKILEDSVPDTPSSAVFMLAAAYSACALMQKNDAPRTADDFMLLIDLAEIRGGINEQISLSKKKENDDMRDLFKRFAKMGAHKSNAPHKEAQEKVFKWLDENYKPGRKHSDMAELLEKEVPREYDTLLKDITAWKKKRGITRECKHLRANAGKSQ